MFLHLAGFLSFVFVVSYLSNDSIRRPAIVDGLMRCGSYLSTTTHWDHFFPISPVGLFLGLVVSAICSQNHHRMELHGQSLVSFSIHSNPLFVSPLTNFFHYLSVPLVLRYQRNNSPENNGYNTQIIPALDPTFVTIMANRPYLFLQTDIPEYLRRSRRRFPLSHGRFVEAETVRNVRGSSLIPTATTWRTGMVNPCLECRKRKSCLGRRIFPRECTKTGCPAAGVGRSFGKLPL